MDDYISREAAMAMPLANGQYDHEHANEHFILGLESYKEWLEYVPAADVAEVVRCRDCVSCVDGFVCKDGQFHGMTFPSNFCSDGERRADNG